MTNMTRFVPHQPEQMITAKISAREADLLKKLRRYSFGHFTIHKADNLLVRFEANESLLIEEQSGLELSIG